MSDDRLVAVVDDENHRVSVFSVDGEFVRHVGVGVLKSPRGVVCSACHELVVADCGYRSNRIAVFNADGEMVMSMGCGNFRAVAMHGGTVFAHDYSYSSMCVVFE
jgi:DNA-binding beta-propeller fold protein YncE